MLKELANLFRKKTGAPDVKAPEKKEPVIDAAETQKAEELPERTETKKPKTDWAAFLAGELGITKEEAQKKLDYVKRDFGIEAAAYCRNRYFEMSEAAMATGYRRHNVLETIRRQKFKEIRELTGKRRRQIRAELIAVRQKDPGFRVDPDWSYNTGAYMFDPDSAEMDELIALCRRKEALKAELHECFRRIDRGEADYASISEQLDEYRGFIEKTLSGLKRNRISERFKDQLAAMDEKAAAEMVTDIELAYELLGFSQDEYMAYHFQDRSLAEKREYVSSELRAKVIASLNTQEGSDLLNDKYAAYCRLAGLYGREAVLLDSENGYETFREFCSRHSSFVRKHNYDSLGRGILKIELQPDVALENVYKEVISDGNRVLLEELIRPCSEIKALNSDSVNTVRIITFLDGGEPAIQDSFMKIGRKGSFVDNGGAGGIFVHVDPETGVFDSDGVDEQSTRYEEHPDHGYVFRGIELPDWSGALETAKAAARMVPEARYIGWDLTRTETGKWIIVEGNAKTQFFAQQMTRGRGVKREFLDSVHADAKGPERI